jgi:hypothetical protein
MTMTMTIPVPHDATTEKTRVYATKLRAMIDAPLRQARANVFKRRAWSAEQELALAVLAQAIQDAHDAHLAEPVRASASAFLLTQTAMFEFWIAVAGLNAEVVQHHARQWIVDQPNLSHGRD